MNKKNKRPLKILHVVYKLNRGGIGNWLLNVMRYMDPNRFHTNFLAHDLAPGDNDAEIIGLGGEILYCPYPTQIWKYGKNVKKIIEQYGPYDIVHSHLSNCGYHVKLAAETGVPKRIAHSHSIYWKRLMGISAKAKLARLISWPFLHFWLERYATLGLAASPAAAASLFGSKWRENKRWQVLPCAVDLEPFKEKVDRLALRAELGIPEDAFVIGHVGRFTKEKNHAFIIEIAAEIERQHPNMRLLLVGEGSLRTTMEEYAHKMGLAEKIIFTGLRRDVPRLMSGVMDLFIFPSIYEGLGLVLVEAQAAGLPSLISETIPNDAIVIPSLVQRLSLSEPRSTWATTAMDYLKAKDTLDRSQALKKMEESLFNIKVNIKHLEKIYSSDIS